MSDKITAPGIYFGLEESEYHADPSLSSSGIRKLLVSPLTYWASSHMNPDYEDATTDAMLAGKAFDKRIVEGEVAFYEDIAVALDPADYPDAVAGGADLRVRCADLGLVKNGTIAEMCARILEADGDAQLWPLMVEAHAEENAGKQFISADLEKRIQRSARIVEAHPSARKAFDGGHPQVSVFWIDEETGVPMKSRFDYLKIRSVVDLKTFSNPLGKRLDTAVAHAVANYRYHVQAAVYMDAAERAKHLPTFGEGPTPEWRAAFEESPDHAFVFVFQESGAAPNLRIREFRRLVNGKPTVAWQSGHDAYRYAVNLYTRFRDQYGENPWIDDQPMTPFTDDEFPIWMME